MITFIDFVHKYKLKNKATSNIKIQQVLCSIGSNNVGIYLRDGPFESNLGVVSLHPSKRTHWAAYKNENYFDSYGCASPRKLSKPIMKGNGHCLYSECKIQGLTNKRDSLCKLLFIYSSFDKSDRYWY